MRHPLGLPYGFADASLVRYERKEDRLVVDVKLWNEIEVSLLFSDTLSVLDRGMGDISDVVESLESEFFDMALAYNYDVAPAQADRPRLFQFLSVDGEPALEIVAGSVSVASR
jgi:hypothetical protein